MESCVISQSRKVSLGRSPVASLWLFALFSVRAEVRVGRAPSFYSHLRCDVHSIKLILFKFICIECIGVTLVNKSM